MTRKVGPPLHDRENLDECSLKQLLGRPLFFSIGLKRGTTLVFFETSQRL